MNDMTPTREQREAKLEGMGCKRKRVEDIRFTQGKGNYVDDLKLPGMLHGDFVRSPHAHARVKKIDDTEALKVPGVLAVITAETLKTVNLAWMPTLAGDVQMVLADGKVLFQNQEVAFVVATDRYAADDGINKVVVEYEPLPVVIDPFKAMDADAPVLREDLAGKTTGAHGPRKHHNHVFEWTVGDKDLTDAAFKKADVTIKEMISYHRTHPSPLETCQCVCSFDKIKGELTIWGTFQAPHVIRTVVALIAKIPEHKIHVISPDIGGGFGNKVGAYPGYICAAVASIVTGKPVKWVEDRIENLTATSFARDYHMTTEIAATKEGKVTGLRVHVLADHGAFDACADPSKWPAGFFNIVTGSYDFPTAHLAVDGIYTNKAPGGVAYRCSFRVTEAAYCIERGDGYSGAEARHGSGRTAAEELHQGGAVPVSLGARLGIRFRRLPHRHAQDDGDGRLCRPAQGAGGEARGVQARRDPRDHGPRRVVLHRDRRRRPVEELRHPRHCDVRLLRDPHAPDRRGHRARRLQEPGPGPRDHLGADHRHRDRHSRRRHHGRGGQHRHRALRARHLRLALDAGGGRRDRHGRAQDQGQGADDRGLQARGARRRPRMGYRRLPRQGPAGEDRCR